MRGRIAGGRSVADEPWAYPLGAAVLQDRVGQRCAGRIVGLDPQQDVAGGNTLLIEQALLPRESERGLPTQRRPEVDEALAGPFERVRCLLGGDAALVGLATTARSSGSKPA